MPTPNLGLSNSNALGSPVSASESNRLHNLVDNQLFSGTLGTLGPGIVQNASGTSLRVSVVAGLIEVEAGSAVVMSEAVLGRASHPVWAKYSGGDSIAPLAGTSYVHAKLVAPSIAGAPNSEEGTAQLVIVVSADDALPGAHYLASVTGGVVTPVNRFTRLDEALRRLLELEAITGYGDGDLENKGSIDARLDELGQVPGGTGGGTGGGNPAAGVTVAMYNALKKTVEDLAKDLAALKESVGGDSPIAVRLAGRVEALRAEHSRLAGSVVRQSPRTAKRLQSAVVLPGLSGISDKLVGGDNQKASYIGGNLRLNRAKRRLE